MMCIHQNCREIHRFDTKPLYACDECGLIFTDRYGQEFDPKSLYRRYYNNEMSGRFGFGIEYIIRLFRFFRAFKVFTIYPNAKSILDIGSGRGFMLYYLKKYYKFKRTAGTQISKNAFEFSKNKLGLEIYDKDLLELSFGKGSFDIITIWHVLEHVAKPEEYIAKIFDILYDQGRLVIEVPNFNSWSRALTGKYWLGLDLDYHINFFTPQSLSFLLKKYKFKIKTIRTFSLEYSTFISTQSMVSLFTKSEHLFFGLLQTSGFSWRLIPHGFLFILFSPFCFLINLSLYFSKRGEVLLIVAEKDKIEFER
ncbi:MAG: class I SAM-dependent methyltransferase [Candidatus Omnitrophica bacterium]|nr:class I SAM-dependent methyltransferase [Candidatus Omnitrophota bacterium]